MSVKTTTVYNCDYCQKQLPDDYATTNGEGKGYYVKKAHDTIPLDTPIAGCTGIVVRRVFYCRNIARASNTGRGTRQRGTLDIADGLNTERSF